MTPTFSQPLRDIHLPNDIFWWPPALGWWIVAFLALVTIIAAIFTLWYFLRPSIKKQALSILKEIEMKYDSTNDCKSCFAELSILLRRVAITQKEINAGLTGIAWLQFLDQGVKQPEFSQGIGKVLLTGPYQAQVDHANVPEVIELCRQWVEREQK